MHGIIEMIERETIYVVACHQQYPENGDEWETEIMAATCVLDSVKNNKFGSKAELGVKTTKWAYEPMNTDRKNMKKNRTKIELSLFLSRNHMLG